MNPRTLPLGLAIAAIGLCAHPALAAKGDWILRGGVGLVDPKSDNLTVDLPAGLTGLPGDTTGEIQVDQGVSATIEVTYMFARRWGIELLAAYPFSHDVDIDVAAVDGGEGSSFAGARFDAGKVKHLPPTLSLQYHFNPEGRFRPYVGAGVNYTTFMSEKSTGILSDIGVTDLELDDSWGLAGQLGADIGITDNWFANVVVRYIDIDTDATLQAGGALDIGTVSIDPWVYQAQIGYRFGRKAAPVAAAAAATAAPTAAPAAPPPPPPPPPADSDRDGVVDAADRCPDTPAGATVDAQGCEQVSLKLAFGNNSADLTAADKAVLDELVARLKARTSAIPLSIEGHTDSNGSDAYNQQLSERRANAVRDYLVGAGIPSSSVSAVGYGESQPVADNATAEGRAANRRVTVRRVAN